MWADSDFLVELFSIEFLIKVPKCQESNSKTFEIS